MAAAKEDDRVTRCLHGFPDCRRFACRWWHSCDIAVDPEAALVEARRQYVMNRSIIEMLKGNTSPDDLADFRRLWVVPWEEKIIDLEDDVNRRTGSANR